MKVTLNVEASRDIDGILEHSEREWGPEASGRYAELIEAGVARLRVAPLGGTRDWSAVSRGLQALHLRVVKDSTGVRAPVHIIYFRVASDTIRIVRVLHERMDVRAYFGTKRAKR